MKRIMKSLSKSPSRNRTRSKDSLSPTSADALAAAASPTSTKPAEEEPYVPKPRETPPNQHGVKGVYYGGTWLDLEDCGAVFTNVQAGKDGCSGCDLWSTPRCPRSVSRNATSPKPVYDVCIIGAGCIGAAIARELSKYDLSIIWLEAADDVSQGATKGNSGIVHAGYDDTPGTNRAKYCWPGNQMFAQLDKELRFGYQKNGSLVLAFTQEEAEHLNELKQRGETNGVQHLEILTREQVLEKEPYTNPKVLAALYSPDAGNVIPYEFAIALAENAVDNGVELRLRRQVTNIEQRDDGTLVITVKHWEPKSYVKAVQKYVRRLYATKFWFVKPAIMGLGWGVAIALLKANPAVVAYIQGEEEAQNLAVPDFWQEPSSGGWPVGMWYLIACIVAPILVLFMPPLIGRDLKRNLKRAGGEDPRAENVPRMAKDVLEKIEGKKDPNPRKRKKPVKVEDMLLGGSGSPGVMKGVTIGMEQVVAKYVINCAGGASDAIARMVGDASFSIKPRVGDYLLLNRNQGHLTTHTLFPCPDPKLGKGVLVQTTLWGNLILGPTARDMDNVRAKHMSAGSVQDYILQRCKKLVPYFDPKETFHAFAGARAKCDRGDWVIECCKQAKNKMIHVAGIDSPGLAGAPAIALEVVRMLKEEAGMKQMSKNDNFQPNRAPIITPKDGMRGMKMGPIGKNDYDPNDPNRPVDLKAREKQMAANVVCKCEKVTELEIVRAMRRSLPIDSSQGIRKRTRAGMGHCQADPDNYACEARVRAIIARENGVPVEQVGGRPWPATSTLTERWINDDEKEGLEMRMNGQDPSKKKKK